MQRNKDIGLFAKPSRFGLKNWCDDQGSYFNPAGENKSTKKRAIARFL